jgi:DNA processing protein
MTTRLGHRDPGYPSLLATMSSPPTLAVRGRLAPEDALAVAIVGARRASAYGLEVAERLASELAARGVTIVSGLARGIDTAAHRGALAAGGRTLAILGTGIDVIYPPENRRLAADIQNQGAVLSQFPDGSPPLPGQFPARNRTLAGLALGVVVVEATLRSGALITAGFAGDLGREVFAVPGRVTSELSAGPHRLIQEGATLVQQWTDIVQELPEAARRAVLAAPVTSAQADLPTPGSDEGRVLAALSCDAPQHIEQLIARCSMEPARLAATLIDLELTGWARQLAGQRWVAAAAKARRA